MAGASSDRPGCVISLLLRCSCMPAIHQNKQQQKPSAIRTSAQTLQDTMLYISYGMHNKLHLSTACAYSCLLFTHTTCY
jgi:hypothetical protein